MAVSGFYVGEKHMIGIHGRLTRAICFRWGYKPFLIVGAVVLIMIVWSQIERNSVAEEEKRLAIEDCLADNPDGDCRETIEMNHQRCFDLSYHSGSKYSKARFNRAGYRRCVAIGADEFLARQRQDEADARRLARSLLE